MNDYYQVRFDIHPAPSEDATDLLAALLGDCCFESFVPDENGLTAYVKAGDYDASAVKEAVEFCPMIEDVEIKAEFIEGKDWNSEWERNYFQPIVVGDRCVIHSSFHTDYPKLPIEIIIDPKMAFGTGHHATTSLVIEQMLSLDLTGKSVIDMGTGTGILAILAAMLGAGHVIGIEIDPMACENAAENVVSNHHPEVDIRLGDATLLDTLTPADLFIANINRNIITADIASYAASLISGGVMLLSGFYEKDIPVVTAAAAPFGLSEVCHLVRDEWTCLKMIKK